MPITPISQTINCPVPTLLQMTSDNTGPAVLLRQDSSHLIGSPDSETSTSPLEHRPVAANGPREPTNGLIVCLSCLKSYLEPATAQRRSPYQPTFSQLSPVSSCCARRNLSMAKKACVAAGWCGVCWVNYVVKYFRMGVKIV